MKSHSNKQYTQMAQHISESIGLNYLMAEAVRDGCQLILKAGRSPDESPIRTISRLGQSPLWNESPEYDSSPSSETSFSLRSSRSSPNVKSQRCSVPLGIPRASSALRAASWPSCASDSDDDDSLGEIEWCGESCVLPCLYEAAFKLIVLFLMRNHKSIVKLQMVNDSFYPINKNIIIYVPYSSDIRKIKRR